MEEFDKKYYKIKDVAEILSVPASTLRYWESEFPEISPRRSDTNRRYYSPDDIRILRIIRYLLKDKGLRMDAVKREFADNRRNLSRRVEAINILEKTRAELEGMLAALVRRH